MEPSSKNFPVQELRCKCPVCMCQVPNEINPESLVRLQKLRDILGFPLYINSAYRCYKHKREAIKAVPGRHNKGMAFDISVSWGERRMNIVREATKLGFTGFGFANTFLHIDDDGDVLRSWSYT